MEFETWDDTLGYVPKFVIEGQQGILRRWWEQLEKNKYSSAYACGMDGIRCCIYEKLLLSMKGKKKYY